MPHSGLEIPGEGCIYALQRQQQAGPVIGDVPQPHSHARVLVAAEDIPGHVCLREEVNLESPLPRDTAVLSARRNLVYVRGTSCLVLSRCDG